MKKKRKSRVRKGSTKNWGQKGPSVQMPATIAVPSGRCPFVMEDTEEETVKEWVMELTKWKASPITYKQSAYVYWIRHSFDCNTDEYRKVKRIVEKVVPERVKSVNDLSFGLGSAVEE